MVIHAMAKFELTPSVYISVVGDDAVALDSDAGIYFSLNSTAHAFVARLCEGESFDEAMESIEREYNIGSSDVRSEFQLLLESLLEKKLIRLRMSV